MHVYTLANSLSFHAIITESLHAIIACSSQVDEESDLPAPNQKRLELHQLLVNLSFSSTLTMCVILVLSTSSDDCLHI